MIWIWLLALAATIAAVGILRNRYYATFVAVLVGVQVLVWWALFSDPGAISYAAWGFSGLVFVHYLALIRPRMRSLPYRMLISWPASWFVAGTILAIPWAVAVAFGAPPVGWWLAYLVAFVGLVQSLSHRPTTLDLVLDGTLAEQLGRLAHGEPTTDRPLKIAHITDTHLGPFVSEARLRRAMERIVAQEPDLVLLTGDFMTMESNGDAEMLERAFAPLRAMSGRVFACRGNHDLESPQTVDRAFKSLGIKLLIDEDVVVPTALGPLQVVGIDYHFRDPAQNVRAVSEQLPRIDGCPRVVLLHHPGHFTHIPDGLGDLVLSGHTHGGQVGLVDLGVDVTMARLFVKKMPDHGFWGMGRNRLYVNRGFGHYGFPLRIGVRAEEALLQVHLPM